MKTTKSCKLDNIYTFLSSSLFQISCPFRGIIKISFLANDMLLASAIPVYPCLPLRRLSHRLGPAGQLWSFSSNFIQSCLPLIRLSLRLTPSRVICRACNRFSLGRDAIDDEFGNLLSRPLLYTHCRHITSRLPPQIQIAPDPNRAEAVVPAHGGSR